MPKTMSAPEKGPSRVGLWLRLSAGVLILSSAAFGAVEFNRWITSDPRFRFSCERASGTCAALEIHGVEHFDRARVESVFAPDIGAGISRIPVAERRRQLLAIDWVSTAVVSRVWPNRILVAITERKPIAFARLPLLETGRYRLALIDDSGILLSLPSAAARGHFHFRLPVIGGLAEEQTEAERARRVKAVGHLLEDLGPLSADVSEVNATSVEDLGVITEMDGRAVELWIGDQHYQSRYRNFRNNYEEIRKHSPDSNVFDLRMDDRILTR